MNRITPNHCLAAAIVVTIGMLTTSPSSALDHDEASQALRRAVEYYTAHVATEGGYLYRYSEDLSQREGEHKATSSMVWVQPPGTPAVGMAYLNASEATDDPYYLDAARAVGSCLVRGQLESGGWYYSIEFDPAKRKKFRYRVAPNGNKGENVSTLDDNNTQAAVRFLMLLDRALDFKDATIHEAATYALDHIVVAQASNGAWPQRFEAPADRSLSADGRATYPDSWSRTWPNIKYSDFYTFNDNAMGDTIEVMLEAAEIYNSSTYRESALRCGDFMLRAQVPEPQPAWAQQYDFDLHPTWARKFEPPSITGGESQSILLSLLLLHRETGDRKYLKPVKPALEYLEHCVLPDGRLARFYELQTNRPLYFTHDYQLTYDDSDVPTHYSFKVPSRLKQIRNQYERQEAMLLAELRDSAKRQTPTKPSKQTIAEAQEAIDSLDTQGRWLEEGRLRTHEPTGPDMRILRTETYLRNLRAITKYLADSSRES